MDHVLAADVGGTNIRIGIVDRAGEITGQEFGTTPADGSAEEIADAISEVAIKVAASAGIDPGHFGLALPAVIDFDCSQASFATNLQQLNGIDLGKMVGSRTGLKVTLGNDSVSAAVGEHWLGSARGFANVVCVTLGTGVGGGLIINDEPYFGANGSAGHIGHICVEANGHPCPCGGQGCIEQYASATAILRMAIEKGGRYVLENDDLSADDVSDAAANGDAGAISVFGVMGYYLAIALGGLINTLNPEVIVLTGGAAKAWPHFIGPTLTELKKRAFQQPLERVKIVRGELGDNAGILGAASQAFTVADKGNSRF